MDLYDFETIYTLRFQLKKQSKQTNKQTSKQSNLLILTVLCEKKEFLIRINKEKKQQNKTKN